MQTLEDGAPLDAANDIRYNGRQASPVDPFVDRGYIPPSVLVRITTAEAELGRSLTADERAALIKKLWR
jgi:hypothetical protein